MPSGIKVVTETEGTGHRAEKGDIVVFDCAASLNKGSAVHARRTQTLVLGSRRFIAGVEDKVPPNAVLIYELWLTSIKKRGLTTASTRTRARPARAGNAER